MAVLVGLVYLIVVSGAAADSKPAKWGDTRVVEDLRIGQLDGPDEYMFGDIADIAIAPDGSIYVADRQLVSIRLYDPNGAYVRDVGHQGEGPGEYLHLAEMRVLPDGSLAVLASGPNRVTIFEPDGKYRSDFSLLSGLSASRMLECDTSGNIYVRDVATPPNPGEEWTFVFVKMSSTGKELTRIAIPREKASDEGFVLTTSEGPMWSFKTATLHAMSPLGYLVVGRNDEYAFDLVGIDGKTVRRISRDFDPVPLNSDEKKEWKAWAEYFGRSRRPDTPNSYSIPDRKPAFKDIFVDGEGRIWVQRYVAAEKSDIPPRKPGDDRPLLTWREPVTFDAFEPEGRFLGTVVIPRDTVIRQWRVPYMWGIQTTDNGEQVVRYRIDGAHE